MGIKNKIKSTILGAAMLAAAASPSFGKDKFQPDMDMVTALAQRYGVELTEKPFYFHQKYTKKEVNKNTNGGKDLNPSFYNATANEVNLLAAAIAAEANGLSLEEQIAVAETLLRRAMSSEWYKGKQDTIHSVLFAKGQYPTTVDKITGKREHKNPVSKETQIAALIALSGTTNFSKGTYFQHHNAKHDVVKFEGGTFSNNKNTSKYKLKDWDDMVKHEIVAQIEQQKQNKQGPKELNEFEKTFAQKSPTQKEAEQKLAEYLAQANSKSIDEFNAKFNAELDELFAKPFETPPQAPKHVASLKKPLRPDCEPERY